MRPGIKRPSVRTVMPWDLPSTLATLEFILNPAPRVTLLIKSCHMPAQNPPVAPHLIWNKTPNSHNDLQGHSYSNLRALSHLISYLAPLCKLHSRLLAGYWLSGSPSNTSKGPLFVVFAISVPSAWYAFPQKFMAHSYFI